MIVIVRALRGAAWVEVDDTRTGVVGHMGRACPTCAVAVGTLPTLRLVQGFWGHVVTPVVSGRIRRATDGRCP